MKQFERHRRLVKALSPQCFRKVKVSFLVRVLQSSGLSHGGTTGHSNRHQKNNQKQGKMGVLHGLTWNRTNRML